MKTGFTIAQNFLKRSKKKESLTGYQVAQIVIDRAKNKKCQKVGPQGANLAGEPTPRLNI